MAAIEQLFRAHIAGDAGIAALVSNRIYPNEAPENASYPFIVYQAVGSVEALVKPEVATLRLVRKRIQVDCYAKTYTTCKDLEAAVKVAAYAFNGSVSSAVVQTRIADTVDGGDEDEDIRRTSVDVSILFNE